MVILIVICGDVDSHITGHKLAYHLKLEVSCGLGYLPKPNNGV
jgi:hypothetical protein